ncbi:MAG: hypothetical protein NT062_16190 [Proteobacteria bacterium]|nr:hypothetical protein [Pseudomonadota bacterium]
MSNQVTKAADDVAPAVSALAGNAADRIEHRVDALSELIHENPLLAVGIGLGAGYLIARLVHR